MKIYKLWPGDVPLGLVARTNEEQRRINNMMGSPVGDNWTTPVLKIARYASTSHDYSLRDIELWPTGEPMLNQKSLSYLRNILDPWIELLPAVAPDGTERYLCNITQKMDVLDIEKSHIIKRPSGSIQAITKICFREELLTNISLFRIPQRPITTYATDRFVERARSAKLTGLDFRSPDERDPRMAGPRGRLPG